MNIFKNFATYFALCIVVFVGVLFSSSKASLINSPTELGYLVSAPVILRSGVDQTISIRIFHHKEEVLVNATIINWRDKNTITSASARIKENGIITLRVPKGERGKATLQICGNCDLKSSFQFYNSTTITIVDKGSSAFIQTDKPIYKPLQRVYINVYTLDRDLRPTSENVKVFIKSPTGVKIVEWKNLSPFCCGTVNVSFPLSDQPQLGEWKVFAEIGGNSFNTTFEVLKYVLPKFEVIIRPPLSFRDFSVCEKAMVAAKYTFGKPVRGNLLVNMTVTGVGYSRKDMVNGETTIRNMSFNGEARFAVCIQDNLGRKHLKRHFRGKLSIHATVTSEDGSQFTAFDDTTIVSRHFVELEFTSYTRRHFKPGIPFNGMIRSQYLNGTGAANVLVQLNVEDHRGIFMSQDLLSGPDGFIPFSIPAPSQSAKFMWLNARVVEIDGVRAGHHYDSVHHDLHSWHSPSQCNILAETPAYELQVGTPIEVTIKSSCPCNFTLNYELLSRGNIVKTGWMKVNSTNSLSLTNNLESPDSYHNGEFMYANNELRNSEHVCRTFIRLTPTVSMAPLSKLLVYYVRTDGEGIADSIQFPVQLKLENKVTLEVSKQAVSPGEHTNVMVRSSGDSCVCLGLIDNSIHVMRPKYFFSHYDIVDEMLSYDMDNLPFEEQNAWLFQFHRRRRRSPLGGQHVWRSRDSFHAFLEAGLVVMTNVVRLDHKQSTQVFSEIRRQALQQTTPAKTKFRRQRRLRSYFPDTWFWQCFNLSSTGVTNISLVVPDSITSWKASAVAISPQYGIGMSDSLKLTTFKPFFVEFNLPYSVIRGEKVKIPVTVHNYLGVCSQIRLAVVVSQGVTFGSSRRRKAIRHLCVATKSTGVTDFYLTFETLGQSKIIAVADAIESTNSCCDKDKRVENSVSTNYTSAHNEAFSAAFIGKDAITKKILVEAEGDPRDYTHSLFFCPNERMNITTPPSTFHFVKFSKNSSRFNFLVKALSSVHIALANMEIISESTYEIVLGGQENTRSWIQKDDQILKAKLTHDILSTDEFRSFWIDWSGSNITVGYGMENTANSKFLVLKVSENINVSYIGLATTGKSTASFRLWSKDDHSDGFSEVFQLDVPKSAIPGSIRGRATVIGDVMGPTLKNLNNLLSLPYGCGEQNMINFAPNAHILKYLKRTNQLTPSIEAQATEYLMQGYQRQLTYKRGNGSYSAFGDRDKHGSMWLTAFVMKSYSEASKFIFIDEHEIHHAADWIILNQSPDGSFPAIGRILNKDVQGGIRKEIALTAYVVIALQQINSNNKDVGLAIERAVTYLESVLYEYQDPYTAALTAFALTLSGSSYAHESRQILLDMSLTSPSGTYRYWSLSGHVDMPIFFDRMKQTVASAEVELASYALLAFTKAEDVSTSLPIVRWISKQRNSQGGFSSTQDTCMALQALSSYATFAYIGGVNLNITLEGPDNYILNFQLNNTNSDILQTGGIPTLNSLSSIPVFVKANGDGCALLQINIQYNIPQPNGDKAFDLEVTVQSKDFRADSTTGSRYMSTKETSDVKACMRWLHQGSSNMAVFEFRMLTGYAPDADSLEKAISNRTKSLKRYEIEKSKILFYFDEISSMCKTCVEFKIYKEFDTTNVQSKPAKVFDYYEPGFESTVFYKVTSGAENCDSRGNCEIEAAKTPEESFGNSFYPECQCYNECSYNGPQVCGSDGVKYVNLCRLEVISCETQNHVQPQSDYLCEADKIVDPLGEYGYMRNEMFEVYPSDEAADGYSLFPPSYY